MGQKKIRLTNPITTSLPHPMLCVIEKEVNAGDVLNFLLLSDLHFDHPKCRRDILKAHLDQIVEKDGYILLNGDTLCVMQGKFDKRHNKADVRPENMVATYFDSIVDDLVDFFEPYAHRILFIGSGNHESAIVKRHETDLLTRFAEQMYHRTKHRIQVGQYHGFIYIKALYGDKKDRRTVCTLSYKIYYNHGAGGDAPVTQGSIEDSRKMTHVEGADALWMGHNHNKYTKQVAVMYLSTHPKCTKPRIRTVENIRTGTYKQEYTGAGWHIETGKPPKPLGGIFLALKVSRGEGDNTGAAFLAPYLTPTFVGEIDL